MTIPLDPESHALVISNDAGRALLRLDCRAGTIDGAIEDMGEAARVFVNHVRMMLGMPAPVSTPPADDVREALADVQWMEHGGVGQRDEWKRLGYAGAVAVMRAFEVRPRGTVTDAEVEAGAIALHAEECGDDACDHILNEFEASSRAVLEAAREAGS